MNLNNIGLVRQQPPQLKNKLSNYFISLKTSTKSDLGSFTVHTSSPDTVELSWSFFQVEPKSS